VVVVSADEARLASSHTKEETSSLIWRTCLRPFFLSLLFSLFFVSSRESKAL
jgi:hypothetical protein